MKMHRILLLSLVFIISSSSTKKKVNYSFFIAGHTYGNPNEKHESGLHKPFKEKIDFISNKKFNDNSVGFESIHLNGNNINSLGKLEDYVNPYNLK